MSSYDINSQTIGGTIVFCDWLISKGYSTDSQVNPWKIALKQVFGTVENEDYESFDWTNVDLDEYLERFQRMAGQNYKTESIVAYGRRVKNALDAHKYYLETGRAPSFSRRASRKKAEKPAAPVAASGTVTPIGAAPSVPATPDMVTFPYPLSDGRMISMTMPPRMKADDINRITAFIRTLQEEASDQRQLPSGQRAAA